MKPVIRGNSLYTIVSGPSWTQAQANSLLLGGNLVTINDSREDSFIWNEVWDGPSRPYSWIGLTDSVQEGQWRWISGEPVTYTNWAPGEPNNAGGAQHYAWYWNAYPGKWDDHINQPNNVKNGIAEVPLTCTITIPSVVKEGAGIFTTSINISAGTSTLANGAVVYWKVSGITSEDLASGALSGSGEIVNGKLEIQHSLIQDSDSGERFSVSVFSHSFETNQIGTSTSATIQEGPLPSYSLSGPYSVSEGSYVQAAASTANLAANTSLYWSITGGGITSEDISGVLNGTGTTDAFGKLEIAFNINNDLKTEGTESLEIKLFGPDGRFSFSHTLANDLTTEGTENLEIKLFTDSARTNQVATTTIAIQDTSTTPIPTYSLNTSSSSVREGDSFSSTVSTSNLPAGTTLYYALKGAGITAADFSSGSLTGSGSIGPDGKFSFSHTLANDLTTEGTENLEKVLELPLPTSPLDP